MVPDQYNKCDKENIIRQLLKVQAQITVTPLVKHGIPKVHCINSCITPNTDCCHYECYDFNYGDCNCCNCSGRNPNYDTTCESGRLNNKCNFTLTQVICVEIPIYIDAEVDIKERIVCCDRPDVKPIDNKNKPFYMQMI